MNSIGGTNAIVVYGGTSAGIAAAVQAARMKMPVVLLVPEKQLGGLTAGGLGWTDIGNKNVIGGISREFYHRIWQHYQQLSAWQQENRSAFKQQAQGVKLSADEQTMWVFEPHVAERVYLDLLAEAKVPVVRGERLDRKAGVRKDGARITTITMESGLVATGAVFIDATYEGDLMAAAKVAYTIGREANSVYNETLNGVQTAKADKNQLPKGVNAYVEPGKATSGLLPGISEDPGRDGEGDARVQAYCFRMCLTDAAGNSVPVEKPEGYDEREYELLFRAIKAGQRGDFFKFSPMPNRKTDSNNADGISTDFIGRNHAYPEADYATREEISKAHERYQKGLVWTLQHHPRVPQEVREKYAKWGLPRDEFIGNGNWTPQLYVREARRMKSAYVMTEHNCRGKQKAPDSVGMAAYTMDSHNVQRYVDKNGSVRNEGDVQVPGGAPYPVSYRAIVPAVGECANLLVPVCLSSSHIAYGSIRMEPVFMVLGQSAATAAVLACQRGIRVQDVPYDVLKERLVADGQILAASASHMP